MKHQHHHRQQTKRVSALSEHYIFVEHKDFSLTMTGLELAILAHNYTLYKRTEMGLTKNVLYPALKCFSYETNSFQLTASIRSLKLSFHFNHTIKFTRSDFYELNKHLCLKKIVELNHNIVGEIMGSFHTITDID